MVMKPYYWGLIVEGKKTLELRPSRMAPTKRWVGKQGVFWGTFTHGEPFLIETDERFAALHHLHHAEADKRWYKRATWALPIVDVEVFTDATLRYKLHPGAVSPVLYEPVDDGADASAPPPTAGKGRPSKRVRKRPGAAMAPPIEPAAEQQDDVERTNQEFEVFSETGAVDHGSGVEHDRDAATEAYLRSEGYDLGGVHAPLDLHDFVPVPPDGLCLFYAAIAARNVDAWMDTGRDRGRGWQTDRDVERAQVAEAKAMRDLVIYELENDGKQHMADRLRRGEYPGDDELPYLAHVLGCQIQRLHWQEPARSFSAPSDTCWFSILHQVVTGEDGHQAPHWVLKETRLAPGSLYVYTEGPVVPAAAAGRGGASRLPLSASERPAKRRKANDFFEAEAAVDDDDDDGHSEHQEDPDGPKLRKSNHPANRCGLALQEESPSA
jgi:hypothetical protein